MSALVDLALKNMKFDAQLVSALYRTHKALPNTSKISSLYVFDALARAAKHQAVKRSYPVNVDKGNPATFMLKLEGILEDFFVDLCAATSTVPEIKDKMNKVLDLWSKNSAFPSHLLAKLKGLVNEVDSSAQVTASVNHAQTAASVDPRRSANVSSPFGQAGRVAGASSSPPTGTPPTNGGASALPPALLALLANAASSTSTPTPTAPPLVNTSFPNLVTPTEAPSGTPTSQYSAAQLALIQQLAIAGGLVSPATANPPPPLSNGYGNHQDSQDFRGPPRGGPPNRQFSPRDDHYDDNYRNSYRGDSYGRGGPRGRGRGRGDFGPRGGNDSWRDGGRPPFRGSESWRGGGRGRGGYHHTSRDDDDEDVYQRRSRSRSPPRRSNNDSMHDGKRFENGFEPRRNQPPFGPKQPDPEIATDDFGREIRPSGGDTDTPPSQNPPLPSASSQVSAPIPSFTTQSQQLQTGHNTSQPSPQQTRPSRFSQAAAPLQAIPTFEDNTVHNPVQPASASGSVKPSSSAGQLLPIAPGENVPYLYEFDFTAYDFSLPPAWEALGKSFQITNGYAPSQEELMAIVMMAMQTLQAQAMSQQWNMEASEANIATTGDGSGEGGAIGEGDGQSWNGQYYAGQSAAGVSEMEQSDPTSGAADVKEVTATKSKTTRDPRLARHEDDSPGDGDMSLSPPDSPKATPDNASD